MPEYIIRAEPATKPEGEEARFFLYCRNCGVALQMTEHRKLYCPKCKKCELENPTMVLCCAECNNPLRVTPAPGHRFGSYCASCDFGPSMQDVFLRKI